MKTTKEEAVAFFSEFFGGEHHIPWSSFKPMGDRGWSVSTWAPLATFDTWALTRLVFLAHDRAMRVELMSSRPGMLKIGIWKRERDGGNWERHPTAEQALQAWRSFPLGDPKRVVQ